MRICVYGLGHLGSVTAACLAGAGFAAVGIDNSKETVANLSSGIPPLFEPGLEDLIRAGIAAGLLSFATEPAAAVSEADLVWVTFDTPVDEEDRADVDFVKECIERIFPFLKDGSAVLISSQLPVGSTAELEGRFQHTATGRKVAFACSPENLRLGCAVEDFRIAERIVIGVRDQWARTVIEPVLKLFSDNLIWTTVESAEMAKHALNAFLATCVTFANEIAIVCERVGADAADVERALRADPRVGQKAYVRAGASFAGGTLARDLTFLETLAREHDLPLPLIGSILPSNRELQRWPMRQLVAHLGNLEGRVIALLGLAYKPGTTATRRSVAVELCRQLLERKAKVQVFDPLVRVLPEDLQSNVRLAQSALAAADGADALVIMTEWPEFAGLPIADALDRMRSPLIIDQNRFLERHGIVDPRIRYVTVGKPS